VKIKWLKKALRNLNMEAEYISKENPEATKKLSKEFVIQFLY